MKPDRNKKHALDGEAAGESRFINSRWDLLQLPAFNSLTYAKRFSRPLAFARRMVGRSSRSLGANSLGFLDAYFADKFAADTRLGFPVSMIYRELGRRMAGSSHVWSTQLAFSLSMTRLTQNVQFWLNQASTARTLSTLERTILERERVMTRPRELSQILPYVAMIHRESKEIAKIVEGPSPVILNRALAHETKTLSARADSYATAPFTSLPRWMPYGRADILRHTLRQLTLYLPHARPTDAGNYSGRAVMPFALGQRFDKLALDNVSKIESLVASARARTVLLPAEAADVKYLRRSPWDSPLAGSWLFVEASLAPVLHREFVAPAIRATQDVEADHTEGSKHGRTWIGREEILPVLAKTPFVPLLHARMVASAASASARGEDGPGSAMPAFTFLRREESLPSPLLSYVFARPVRPIAQEQEVIKRAEEKEIVEMVKKEVQTLMSVSSPMMNFSRSDYVRMADEVYSVLVRRLMTEKERLGLHA